LPHPDGPKGRRNRRRQHPADRSPRVGLAIALVWRFDIQSRLAASHKIGGLDERSVTQNGTWQQQDLQNGNSGNLGSIFHSRYWGWRSGAWCARASTIKRSSRDLPNAVTKTIASRSTPGRMAGWVTRSNCRQSMAPRLLGSIHPPGHLHRSVDARRGWPITSRTVHGRRSNTYRRSTGEGAVIG